MSFSQLIVKNQRSLKGLETNAVLVSRESWVYLLESMEVNYYKAKSLSAPEHIKYLPYEERQIHRSVFRAESFSLPSKSGTAQPKSYMLHGVTNAVIEVFIILHKLCNTNGIIRDVTIHQLYEEYLTYKELDASISHMQFYVAMEKLRLHNVISITKNMYGRYTIEICRFMNEKTKKPNYYASVSPIVFTYDFFKLSVAAKKLFLDVCIQQGTRPELARMLTAETLQGQRAYMGGLFQFLHKKHLHQIQSVLKELTTPLPSLNISLFEKCKLVKEYSRKFNKVIVSINKQLRSANESSNAEVYRNWLRPKAIYKRKAALIQKSLQELHIGDLAIHMNKFINVLKHTCHAQTREVLRRLRTLISNNSQPDNLEAVLHKLVRKAFNHRVLDTAAKTGIYSLITHNVNSSMVEETLFRFGNRYSMHSLRNVKRLFTVARDVLEKRYMVPIQEEMYHGKDIRYPEENLFRDYAYKHGVDLNAYFQVEAELRKRLNYEGSSIPSHLREEMLVKIEQLPQAPMRALYPPKDFDLIIFLTKLEKTLRKPHTQKELAVLV
ncbi:hypothetical protein [Ectobacillus panaciterrae]|uniref:hypothetical protein n=1 Tax=Ectobacillus panaciterrae TaxID=363872 RepID=UPI00041A958D|nr:hypothetical protein [Ectobacillus panaciterrae]